MTTPYSQAEIDKAVSMLRDDAIIEGNKALVERMDRMEERLKRVPVAEMTAEEKAAEYDRLMAAGGNPPAPKNPDPAPPTDPKPPAGPVPPGPKPPTDPTPPKRDPYWGDALNA